MAIICGMRNVTGSGKLCLLGMVSTLLQSREIQCDSTWRAPSSLLQYLNFFLIWLYSALIVIDVMFHFILYYRFLFWSYIVDF